MKAKKSQNKPVKKGIYLSDDNAKRLGVHSTMWGVSETDIVNRLIEENLRDYFVSRTPIRNDPAKSAEITEHHQLTTPDEETQAA